MKSDVRGCSTCKPGQENFEVFRMRGKEYCQYDYRTPEGVLYSTVKPTLEACRAAVAAQMAARG
jgi:hypothetical protein